MQFTRCLPSNKLRARYNYNIRNYLFKTVLHLIPHFDSVILLLSHNLRKYLDIALRCSSQLLSVIVLQIDITWKYNIPRYSATAISGGTLPIRILRPYVVGVLRAELGLCQLLWPQSTWGMSEMGRGARSHELA